MRDRPTRLESLGGLRRVDIETGPSAGLRHAVRTGALAQRRQSVGRSSIWSNAALEHGQAAEHVGAEVRCVLPMSRSAVLAGRRRQPTNRRLSASCPWPVPTTNPHPENTMTHGCSVCVDIHTRELEHIGESSERIHLVAAWERGAVLQRRRACGARAHRGRHEAGGPAQPGAGRGLGRSRPPLHRAPASGAGGGDRDDQRLQPRQRRHPADHRRLRSPHRRSGRGSRRLNPNPPRDELWSDLLVAVSSKQSAIHMLSTTRRSAK
jgi:hypothetical protein